MSSPAAAATSAALAASTTATALISLGELRQKLRLPLPLLHDADTQFPRLIIQNFNLAYDFWVFEFKICAQFQVFCILHSISPRILHCDSHPTVQKPKFGP